MKHCYSSWNFISWVLLIFSCLTESRRILKTQHLEFDSKEVNLTSYRSIDSTEDLRRKLFSFKRSLLLPPSDIGIKDPSEHKVTSLPGLKANLDFVHYAGLIPLDANKNHNIFYWLIESPIDAANKPLVIWLNGGPGCSSMDGLWLELGPFRLDERQSVRINPHSWHNAANMLFVDQPVGTGFSFTKLKNGYAKNDESINHHFYLFLINFFRLHQRYLLTSSSGTSYKKTRPIFFTGESHAGHFIPTIVKYLLEKNDELISTSNNNNNNNNNNNIFFNIAGIALGNPWIDPYNQYNPAEFAHGLGLLTRGQVNKLQEQEIKCQRLIQSGNFNSNMCMSLLDHVVDSISPSGHHKVLMYDVRKFLMNPNLFPIGHENVESYLNRREVKQSIHTIETPHLYQECTDPPYFALTHQDGKGVMNEIRYLLDIKKIDILIFNGQYDLICNHLNIEYSLDHFNWTGMNEWLSNKPSIWSINKKPVGYVRKAKNLQTLLGKLSLLLCCFSFFYGLSCCFVVMDAGHMVPMDVPEIALKMFTTFIQKGSFRSGEGRVGVSPRGAEVPSEQTQRGNQ